MDGVRPKTGASGTLSHRAREVKPSLTEYQNTW